MVAGSSLRYGGGSCSSDARGRGNCFPNREYGRFLGVTVQETFESLELLFLDTIRLVAMRLSYH